jgi:hypothetical protein
MIRLYKIRLYNIILDCIKILKINKLNDYLFIYILLNV